jgi:hypothetical protein
MNLDLLKAQGLISFEEITDYTIVTPTVSQFCRRLTGIDFVLIILINEEA